MYRRFCLRSGGVCDPSSGAAVQPFSRHKQICRSQLVGVNCKSLKLEKIVRDLKRGRHTHMFTLTLRCNLESPITWNMLGRQCWAHFYRVASYLFLFAHVSARGRVLPELWVERLLRVPGQETGHHVHRHRLQRHQRQSQRHSAGDQWRVHQTFR